jgi:hypothetical protein
MTNWRAGSKVPIFINNKIPEKIIRPNKAEGYKVARYRYR